MFCFLLQALYFVLFENIYENDEEKFEVDPFEQAMMAGKIMSNDIITEGDGVPFCLSVIFSSWFCHLENIRLNFGQKGNGEHGDKAFNNHYGEMGSYQNTCRLDKALIRKRQTKRHT
jgi:hypothetical protein